MIDVDFVQDLDTKRVVIERKQQLIAMLVVLLAIFLLYTFLKYQQESADTKATPKTEDRKD